MLMRRPQPRVFIPGRAARVEWKAEVRLIANDLVPLRGRKFVHWRDMLDARIVDEDVHGTVRGFRSSAPSRRPRRPWSCRRIVKDVSRHDRFASAARNVSICSALPKPFSTTLRALARERFGNRSANAARGTVTNATLPDKSLLISLRQSRRFAALPASVVVPRLSSNARDSGDCE